jgi:hypothetical protein
MARDAIAESFSSATDELKRTYVDLATKWEELAAQIERESARIGGNTETRFEGAVRH